MQPAVLGTSVNGCLMLASPLGFQDKLPRNCLTLLLGLLSPFCLDSLQELSHQELHRSGTQASASAQAPVLLVLGESLKILAP